MRLRTGLFACAALIVLPHAAEAACYYNGVSYAVGSKICRNGWLEECTPASYWKAIGQCNRDDRNYTPALPRQSASLDTLTVAKVEPSKGDAGKR